MACERDGSKDKRLMLTHIDLGVGSRADHLSGVQLIQQDGINIERLRFLIHRDGEVS